ncbi:hypothetical protein GC209_04420 [bacterium]|nr:hypothetical protein [bacterium]
MTEPRPVTPLTAQRARATIEIVARAVLAGEQVLTYSELARRLGMAKVNGQGLNSYLIEAAALCAEQGLPNVGTFIVSHDSLQAGAAMPAEGSFSDIFYARTGLAREDVPAEQDRVRRFDWRAVSTLSLD